MLTSAFKKALLYCALNPLQSKGRPLAVAAAVWGPVWAAREEVVARETSEKMPITGLEVVTRENQSTFEKSNEGCR